jgi:hypothetical protein
LTATSFTPLIEGMKLSGRRSFQFATTAFFAAMRLVWSDATQNAVLPVPAPAEGGITVVWTATQAAQVPTVFSSADLTHIKRLSSSETDPETGKSARWDGISLGDLIDRTMKSIPNEKKAQIDLVVLKTATGAEALVPRSFIVKYPMLLANRKDHQPLIGFESVAPWTSQSKVRSEGLPLETYFLKGVTQVELGNYRERYGSVYLKSRKEPTALRGEKIFIQNCLSCHDGAKGETGIAEARRSMDQHPTVAGAPKLDERDRRSLKTYLETYQAENAAPGPTAAKR